MSSTGSLWSGSSKPRHEAPHSSPRPATPTRSPCDRAPDLEFPGGVRTQANATEEHDGVHADTIKLFLDAMTVEEYLTAIATSAGSGGVARNDVRSVRIVRRRATVDRTIGTQHMVTARCRTSRSMAGVEVLSEQAAASTRPADAVASSPNGAMERP
jgi:hypothetical protein